MNANFTLGTMYWLNPKLSLEEMERDFADMRDNGFSLVRIFAWWELVESREGFYCFDFIDKAFRAAEKNHLKLMVTIGFYPPLWLSKKLDKCGKNEPGRYPMVMRPEMQTPLSALIQRLVSRYAESPALALWNVWNEPSVNDSRNVDRLSRFAEWIKRKYASLEELRKVWFAEYPVFSLLVPDSMEQLDAAWLSDALAFGTRGRNSVIRCEWERFLCDEACQECLWLEEEVRKYDSKHPTHSNLHSVCSNPLGSHRNFHNLAAVLDTVSCSIHTSNDYRGGTDFYSPVWNYALGTALCYSWTKGTKHTMVGELQAGTTYSHWQRFTPSALDIRFELCRAFGEGLDGVVFWLWRGWRSGTFELGEFSLRNPSDGAETERSREVSRFSEALERLDLQSTLLRRPKANIAILVSQSTNIYRKVLGEDRPWLDIVAEPCHSLFGCYRALQEANFQVDLVTEEEVLGGCLDSYKVLFMPMVEVVGHDVASCIRDFVAAGGCLYADGRCGWLDAPMYMREQIPCNGLAELFGAREADFVMERDMCEIAVGSKKLSGTPMRQVLRALDGASIVGRFADGSPAVIDHDFGKGRCRLVGNALSLCLFNQPNPQVSQWLASFAADCGIAPEFSLPYGVISSHLSSEEKTVVVLHNTTSSAVELSLPSAGDVIGNFYATPYDLSQGQLTCSLPAFATEVFVMRPASV